MEATKALALIRTIEQPNADADKDSAVKEWHRQQFGQAILSEKRRITMSKAMVESPLLKALGIAQRGATPQGVTALTNNPRELFDANMDLASAYATLTSRMEDMSHQPATAAQARKTILPNGQPG